MGALGTTVLVGHEGQHVVDDAMGGRSTFAKEWAAESTSQDILRGIFNLTDFSQFEFNVRGVQIFNIPAMDDSPKGRWLQTTSAFDAAVKDFQEDQKNDQQ